VKPSGTFFLSNTSFSAARPQIFNLSIHHAFRAIKFFFFVFFLFSRKKERGEKRKASSGRRNGREKRSCFFSLFIIVLYLYLFYIFVFRCIIVQTRKRNLKEFLLHQFSCCCVCVRSIFGYIHCLKNTTHFLTTVGENNTTTTRKNEEDENDEEDDDDDDFAAKEDQKRPDFEPRFVCVAVRDVVDGFFAAGRRTTKSISLRRAVPSSGDDGRRRSDLVEDEFRILLIRGRGFGVRVQSRELQLGRLGAGKRGGWGYVRYRTGGRSDYGEYLVRRFRNEREQRAADGNPVDEPKFRQVLWRYYFIQVFDADDFRNVGRFGV